MTLASLRSLLYRTARQAGDVQAITHPRRIPKRVANKVIGRKLVSKVWFR